MSEQTYFNSNGEKITSAQDFMCCSTDVWSVWGYPSEEALILTAINASNTWNEISTNIPYCFSTINRENVFYFGFDFGLMLINISEKVKEFYNQPKATKTDDLYFIQDTVTKNIKIGRSKNPELRLKSLQIGSSNELRLLKTIKNIGCTEKDVHLQFKQLHLHGEWFKASPLLIGYIKDL